MIYQNLNSLLKGKKISNKSIIIKIKTEFQIFLKEK